nr:MAG TPA: hypothetical protein [Caudoviricetes sp.]
MGAARFPIRAYISPCRAGNRFFRRRLAFLQSRRSPFFPAQTLFRVVSLCGRERSSDGSFS